MKYILIVMAVLLIAVYGFKLYLPTSSGVLTFSSGFVEQEKY